MKVEAEHLDNLERLGLIRYGPSSSGVTWADVADTRRTFAATALGIAVVTACQRPHAQSDP